jgi:cytochrome c peroxidase
MVLANPAEMQADTTHMDLDRIGVALAAYLYTLNPFQSPFDRYMNGDTKALDERARHGANLFMGRAQCATCHFAPLFNGLIPPYYKVTEFEVLGTTATDKLDKPRISSDSGRYAIYPLEFYQSAFKTPTVRNAALTAPYMHNGAFHDLESLMDFYNRGGGVGLGLDLPTQTLPARPLNLSKNDVADIILFIQTLSDPAGSIKK